jgi:hypothetical protein
VQNNALEFDTSFGQYAFKLAPVSRVPPEVLECIFACCPVEMSVREAPLLLTRVCRRWREVSHGTRVIWTQIRATNDIVDPWKGISIFMQRSGLLPLALELDCDWSDVAEGRARSIIETIRPQLYRVRDLALQQRDCRLFCSLFPRGTETAMAVLEQLSIGYDEPATGVNRMIGHLRAPRLRRLSAPDPTDFTTLFSLVACLGGLRTARFRGDGPQAWAAPSIFVDVLKGLPQLESLDLHVRGSREQLPAFAALGAPPASVALPELRHLKLEFPPTFRTEAFLAALSVPSLLSLHLRSYSVDEDTDREEHFLDFASVAGGHATYGSLERFRMEGRQVWPLAFSSLLDASPRLERFEFEMIDGVEIADILEALTPAAEPEGLGRASGEDAAAATVRCPRLHYAAMSCDDRVSASALAPFLELRMASGGCTDVRPLRVQLSFGTAEGGFSDADVNVLRPWIERRPRFNCESEYLP